jgi:predicted O-linked N-acetylglucosamine transferase (SPINDLY family)
MAGRWHTVAKRSDDEVTELIRKDSIDILVDLTGHLANNRLPVFARKPAPVQISWIGYPATTGLTAMDYFLTDDVCDPVGHEDLYSEKLVRLSAGFCCYAPPSFAPPVAPLPAARNGYITFGSFHNLVRLNQPVIALWSECLKSVPGSRLLIFRTGMTRQTQARFTDAFGALGIAAARLIFRDAMPAGGTYLDVYAEIDIALDTFPWSGHTTACESLHMGVPIVTLAGDRHAGRMAVSVLQRVNRGEWAAKTSEEYVRICRDLAADIKALAETRAALRDQSATSPVCDGTTFTRALEEEFRKLWRIWCVSRT